MSIVAETVEYVAGIDTHARTHTHTYCLVHARTAAVVDTATFPTSKSGNARAINWIARRSQGSVLAAVEGTSSYGAGITAALTEQGVEVVEVRPAARSTHSHAGKSDQLDAEAAARSVIGRDYDTSPVPARPDHGRRCVSCSPPDRSSISSAPPTAMPSPRCCAPSTWTSTRASHSPTPRSASLPPGAPPAPQPPSTRPSSRGARPVGSRSLSLSRPSCSRTTIASCTS